MKNSDKYGRTYHFPFSPGATKDDRVNNDWWEDCQKIRHLLFTEKLDGENTCLCRDGVYARSHAALTTSPWSSWIRQYWAPRRHDIPEDIEIFGENLEGIHSIEYKDLPSPFFVFAVRDNTRGMWLSWEEVIWYADYFDLNVVPVLDHLDQDLYPEAFSSDIIKRKTIARAEEGSSFTSFDPQTGQPCSREGLVVRNGYEFPVSEFKNNVFKYVRPHHVQTDEHWTKNWRKAVWQS